MDHLEIIGTFSCGKESVEDKRPRVIYPRLYALARHFPNATRWMIDILTPPLKALKP